MKRPIVLLAAFFGASSFLLANSPERYTGPYSEETKQTCEILPSEGLLIEEWELHYDDYHSMLCDDHTHEGAEFNRNLTDRVMIVDGVRDGDKMYFTTPHNTTFSDNFWVMGTISDGKVIFETPLKLATLVGGTNNIYVDPVFFIPCSFQIISDDFLATI